MKITRRTRRADGLTVGEAMDRDAAFLRSIGIDAKDGAPTLHEREEFWQERVRRAVLDALDAISPEGKGWVDGDLPKLFEAVDAQAKAIWERHEMLCKHGNYSDPREHTEIPA